MYNFPFAPDGPFNDGDVPTWNNTTKRWEAQPGGGGGASTWAEVLAEGNESGDNTPVIVSGQALAFNDSGDETQGIIEYLDGDGLNIRTEATVSEFGDSKIILSAGDSPDISGASIQVANGASEGYIDITAGSGLTEDSSGGNIGIAAGNHGGGETGNGGNIQLSAGNSDASAAGVINILGGVGVPGGTINITGGDAAAPNNQGGPVNITGGVGGGEIGSGGSVTIRGGSTNGQVVIQQYDEATAIVVSGEALADPAIVITGSGLAFNGGTPAIAPSVTGATADPALQSLLTVLDSMGLITNNTT